jgi:hypothetical protein
MIRTIFAIIISFHGLIHLLGFVKEWNLTEIKGMSGKTTFPISGSTAKVVGIFWIIACLLIIFSMILFLLNIDWWWIIGAVSIVLSQMLIILYWQDAKFGTVANIILTAGVIIGYGIWSFNLHASTEKISINKYDIRYKYIVTQEKVDKLPFVVKKWLESSNIIGKEFIQNIHLKQKGEMRTTQDGKWMPFEAEQYFTTLQPAFIWTTELIAAPSIFISGIDSYKEGSGSMIIKLLSLYTITNSKGKEINQGSLLRYLAEIVWFPSAALCDYISWEQIDSLSASATMTFGSINDRAIFHFDKDGNFASYEAKRYYDRKEGATLEDWFIEVNPKGYKELNGIRIPVSLSVTWKLKSGDFTWLKLNITDIKYN